MNKKILYVDDEEINLFLFEKSFENDFIIETSLSGKIALEVLEQKDGDFDVVISDMRMPEMNGLEFVKKAKDKFETIKYYILTGYGFNPELEEALEKNSIDMLFKKPFDHDLIKNAIENAN